MAAAVQNQIRKFENKIKPYLYEGPGSQYWTLIEQKTNVKREQVALGIFFNYYYFYHLIIIYHMTRFTWSRSHLFSIWLGQRFSL